MSASMTAASPSRSTLRRGQSLPFEVEPGTALQVLAGRVQVHAAPQWHGARLVMPVQVLDADAVHLFDEGGWLLVDALESATLVWHAPAARATWWQRVGPVLGAALQRLLRPAARIRQAG